MREKKPIIIIGNGGHSKVLTEILQLNQCEIIGFTSPKNEENVYNLSFLGNDSIVYNYSQENILLVNAIGSTQLPVLRKKIFQKFSKAGYKFAQVVHPSAIVSSYSLLGEGAQILAGVVIQPFAEVADNTIVNTAASIDHDCRIGAHCHIAPGAVLSGNVLIGQGSHIGTGSIIIQGIKVGEQVLVGAGSLILKDVNDQAVVYGTPAKEVRK
ncbi:acetyltransferase [Metabacillus sp. FJAT-52054]|uniref:Acetyltransferase n=1 Tax=Metabacillus sediminis TaxID=3117746 RepID=A0ABZ2NG89_9BACI